jgi:hypothetical protein
LSAGRRKCRGGLSWAAVIRKKQKTTQIRAFSEAVDLLVAFCYYSYIALSMIADALRSSTTALPPMIAAESTC